MHRKWRCAAVSLTIILMAASMSAQRLWTVTGQDVPELAAVDQMMRELMQSNDIRVGSAEITIYEGHGVIAYASVIDNTTNDGTAISKKGDASCPRR